MADRAEQGLVERVLFIVALSPDGFVGTGPISSPAMADEAALVAPDAAEFFFDSRGGSAGSSIIHPEQPELVKV